MQLVLKQSDINLALTQYIQSTFGITTEGSDVTIALKTVRTPTPGYNATVDIDPRVVRSEATEVLSEVVKGSAETEEVESVQQGTENKGDVHVEQETDSTSSDVVTELEEDSTELDEGTEVASDEQEPASKKASLFPSKED